MIAYDVLVQTIADWRAGVRPTAPSLPPIPTGAPEVVEEFDSGVVDFDEAQYGDAAEAEYAADAQQAEQAEAVVDFADDDDDAEYAAGEGQYAQGDDPSEAQPAETDQTYQDDDDEQY